MTSSRKSIALAAALFLTAGVFAQDAAPNEADEFDSLFEDAQDVSEPVVVQKEDKNTITIKAQDYSIPLRFSGYMESELGIGYVRDESSDSKNDITGGIDFCNDLTFSARADKTLAIKATVRTEYPGWAFNLYEMYFDYLLFDKVYLTAGKKNTSWGYIRLFSNDDMYDPDDADDSDPLLTNILNDSRLGTSAQVRIPFWTGTITGFALYRGADDEPGYEDMSFAGSIEMTVLHTSINLFGRKYPSENSAQNVYHRNPIIGLEMKRTILDADVYAQGMACIESLNLAKDFGKSVLKGSQITVDDLQGFQKLFFTCGLYKWWDKQDSVIGFNIEFQDVFVPALKSHTRRVAFDSGLKRLGKNKNIKAGVIWQHNIDEKSGTVKPGVVLSGIFPHADWRNGIEVEYGGSYDQMKITIGTSLKVTMNY